MPNLAIVEAIASSNPPRTVVLSGISAAVLFSALDAANRIWDWQGASFDLTLVEVNRIIAILGDARHELMTIQVGEIKATVSGTIPQGCLLCDGATYAKADYPLLYAALATSFIVDSDTFFVPDLRERFSRGAMVAENVGNQGGETNHTLTVDEIPIHSHSIPATATTLAVEPGEVTVLTPIPIISSSTGDTGGGSPHNNLPPYIDVLYYIVAV